LSPTARTLSTAEHRREDVLRTAGPVFAARGLHGTPTTEIARAAGISQAYLFRLFPTKLDLFVALAERCFERTADTFAEAAAAARDRGDDVLSAMGAAYGGLLQNRDELLLQLQAHAAADEPRVRDAVRRGFERLYALVRRESGADDDAVRTWFAHGMLMNVLAAMRADEVDAGWARALVDHREDC